MLLTVVLSLLLTGSFARLEFWSCFSNQPLRWRSSNGVYLCNCRLGFDFKSGQTNDYKTDIYNFPARRSTLKGQFGEQAGKFTCCAVGKYIERDSFILVW